MKKFLIIALSIVSVAVFNSCKENKNQETTKMEEETTEMEVATEEQTPVESNYQKTLSLQGVEFHIKASGDGSLSNLNIYVTGLESNPEPVSMEVEGIIVNAETEDLDSNGSPELLIYTQSAGSGSYGSVIGFSTLNKKSMVPINMPDISNNPEASQGYMGHDEFTIVETSLSRRFPIYLEGDTNSNPTGGTRQIQYKLVAGESLPQFQIVNISNY